MAQNGLYVDGKRFATKADYEAALEDKELIDEIHQLYNLDDEESVRELYKDLTSGKYRFRSSLGKQLDDQVFDLMQQIKTGKFSNKEVTNDKKKKTKKTKNNKENDLTFMPEEMKKQVIREIKAAERKRNLVLVILGFICVGCLGYYGLYYYFVGRTDNTYDEWAKIREADAASVDRTEVIQQAVINYDTDERITPNILEKYKTLYNKNKSLIGWIKIADTIIDYPVMQTSNNEYYLDHNLNQEYDKNGSIFLDTNCDVLKPSTNLIVYGHHMQSGKMFGKLGDYESEKYYKDHQYIEFDTIYEEGLYQVMYVFRSHVYASDEITFKYYQFTDVNSEQEFNSYMQEMSNLSIYDTGVTAKYGDRLLTLSTCDYQEANGRFVVVAKRIQ